MTQDLSNFWSAWGAIDTLQDITHEDIHAWVHHGDDFVQTLKMYQVLYKTHRISTLNENLAHFLTFGGHQGANTFDTSPPFSPPVLFSKTSLPRIQDVEAVFCVFLDAALRAFEDHRHRVGTRFILVDLLDMCNAAAHEAAQFHTTMLIFLAAMAQEITEEFFQSLHQPQKQTLGQKILCTLFKKRKQEQLIARASKRLPKSQRFFKKHVEHMVRTLPLDPYQVFETRDIIDNNVRHPMLPKFRWHTFQNLLDHVPHFYDFKSKILQNAENLCSAHCGEPKTGDVVLCLLGYTLVDAISYFRAYLLYQRQGKKYASVLAQAEENWQRTFLELTEKFAQSAQKHKQNSAPETLFAYLMRALDLPKDASQADIERAYKRFERLSKDHSTMTDVEKQQWMLIQKYYPFLENEEHVTLLKTHTVDALKDGTI